MPDRGDLVQPVDAVVFDSDGVLVDSEATVARSWDTWARRRGLDSDEVMAFARGQRSSETVARFCAEPDRVAAVAEIDRLEMMDTAPVAAIQGALALTASIPRQCWGVVTSGSVALSSARLASAGFPPPPFVITSEEVRNGKPDPEGYLLAIARLGRSAERVAILEDSAAGISAAIGAGAGTVIGVSESALPTSARFVVRDLTALVWTEHGLLVRGTGRLR